MGRQSTVFMETLSYFEEKMHPVYPGLLNNMSSNIQQSRNIKTYNMERKQADNKAEESHIFIFQNIWCSDQLLSSQYCWRCTRYLRRSGFLPQALCRKVPYNAFPKEITVKCLFQGHNNATIVRLKFTVIAAVNDALTYSTALRTIANKLIVNNLMNQDVTRS